MTTNKPIKTLPKSPFFETSVKNYIFGDAVLDYAKAVDEAAIRHDVDAIFIATLRFAELPRIQVVFLSLPLTWILCDPVGEWQMYCPKPYSMLVQREYYLTIVNVP